MLDGAHCAKGKTLFSSASKRHAKATEKFTPQLVQKKYHFYEI